MVRIRFPGRVPRFKKRVPTSKTCPGCGHLFAVAVKAGKSFYTRFWYCKRGCGWACWRPPCPYPCEKCASPTVWAASRESYGCVKCQNRTRLKPKTKFGI